MKKIKLKGWEIGGIVGFIISILFYYIDLGTSYCVKGLSLINFFCSVSTTLKEFGFLAMLLSIPKLFLKNIFGLSGMNEVAILPLMIIIGFLIGALIGYIVYKFKK